MAKQTLLEMTQEILLSMESDIVESITDTAESTAVATLIRRTYWDLFGSLLDQPENYTLFQLVESATLDATPTIMFMPDNVMKLDWIKYNVATADQDYPVWRDMPRWEVKDFIDNSSQLGATGASNVDTLTWEFDTSTGDIPFYYLNDRAPQFYTSPDDYTIIFDGINLEVDAVKLQDGKTLCRGLIDNSFELDDDTTPELNSRQFSLLVNESKALCFAELKQTQNVKAEQRSRRLLIANQRTKQRVGSPDNFNYVNYGKKR